MLSSRTQALLGPLLVRLERSRLRGGMSSVHCSAFRPVPLTLSCISARLAELSSSSSSSGPVKRLLHSQQRCRSQRLSADQDESTSAGSTLDLRLRPRRPTPACANPAFTARRRLRFQQRCDRTPLTRPAELRSTTFSARRPLTLSWGEKHATDGAIAGAGELAALARAHSAAGSLLRGSLSPCDSPTPSSRSLDDHERRIDHHR